MRSTLQRVQVAEGVVRRRIELDSRQHNVQQFGGLLGWGGAMSAEYLLVFVEGEKLRFAGATVVLQQRQTEAQLSHQVALGS